MAQILDQNIEIQVEETLAPSFSTASGGDVSTLEVSSDSTLPSLAGDDQRQFISSTDRARGYVAARPTLPIHAKRMLTIAGVTFLAGWQKQLGLGVLRCGIAHRIMVLLNPPN